jgi:hypothetical protein
VVFVLKADYTLEGFDMMGRIYAQLKKNKKKLVEKREKQIK